ncbi:hypothetical protein GCM10027028_51150 [Streptomyces sundarbansensis]
MIHWIAETEAPVSRVMLGIAMLTIVTSTRSMKAAVITMASANQRRRSAGADTGAEAAAVAPGVPTASAGVSTGATGVSTGATGGVFTAVGDGGGTRCGAAGGGGAEEGMGGT